MKVLVINGPNLNLLGERNKEVYGTQTLRAIEERMEERADEYGWEIVFERTNSEGTIVDLLQEARADCDAVILNAGAYTHYSYAIRDAIEAIDVPVIEVHLSNIYAREPFRAVSVLSPVCRGTISGFGAASYVLAMEALVEIVE